MMMTAWGWYLAIGAVAGVLAGLLGVGGGLVIVPALVFVFHQQGLPADWVPHLALGTSLASIVFTSLSSCRAHHRAQNVDWGVVRHISPGIVLGTLCGSLLAAQLSPVFLKVFFVVFATLVSIQMGFGLRPPARGALPGWPGMGLAGGVIGAVSSWVGIGGGSLSVPFLSWCQVPLKRAIGTSSAIGLPIALAGAVGYVLAGWGKPGLPAASLGLVYLPALAGIVLTSVLCAPLGAYWALKAPVAALKRGFALLLLLGAIKMASSLL